MSRVTLSAPIKMPLLGQLTRSWCRVVSVVIVSPQLTLAACAALPLIAMAPATARATIAAVETIVARDLWKRTAAGTAYPLCLTAGRSAAFSRPYIRHSASTSFPGARRRPLSSTAPGGRSGRAATLIRMYSPERDGVHGLLDLVHDQVGQLSPLLPVEPL